MGLGTNIYAIKEEKKMKQYRLAKDFLGFKKGEKFKPTDMGWVRICDDKDHPYFGMRESIAIANPDIFEEVKGVEDLVRDILDDYYVKRYSLYCNHDLTTAQYDNSRKILHEEYRNKILALLTKEGGMKTLLEQLLQLLEVFIITMIMLGISLSFRWLFGFEYAILFSIAFSYAGLIGKIRKGRYEKE